MSHHTTRFDRMQHSMTIFGVSVLHSAITTFCAAFLLLFAYITVFPAFGIFIAVAIGSSFVYANTVLPAIIYVIGPTGGTGDVWKMISQRTLRPK